MLPLADSAVGYGLAESGGVLDLPVKTNLLRWYDAADDASVTRDVDGVVSQWNDKSGNAAHATQATPIRQPTFNATERAIVFAGTSDANADHLIVPALSTTAISVFMVAKLNVSDPRGLIEFLLGHSALNKQFRVNTDNRILLFGGGTNSPSPNAISPTPSERAVNFSVVRSGTGTNQSEYFANGTSLGTATITGTADFDRIGVIFNGSYLNADVYEIAIYNAALSVADRQAIEAYLAAKWSLS